MKRRLIATLLFLVTLIHLLLLSGCKSHADSDPGQQVMTRGEWISLLGQTLGMSDYQGDTSYYQDVDPDSDIYPYIQSCYEWGVLSGDGQFNANDAATPEFVASTAALATGTVPDELLSDNKAIEEFAQNQGLFPDGKKNVSIEAGLAIAESAQRVYMDDHHENIVDITWTDGVVDLSDSISMSADGTQMTLPTAQAESLAIGSVVIVTSEDGTLAAKKVTSLNSEDGQTVMQTEEPDLGEVFDEITLYDSSAPDMSSVALADGVAMGPVANSMIATTEMDGIYIDDLVNRGSDNTAAIATKGASFTLGINFTKGTVSASPAFENKKATLERLTPSFASDSIIGASPQEQLGKIFSESNFIAAHTFTISDLALIGEDGWAIELEMIDKYEGGYEITGSIGINNLYVETGFEFKKIIGIPTGIKRAVVEVNADFSTNLSLKGTLSEELKIATLPIPIAGNTATVKVELMLYADASGELQIRADVKNNVKFEYSDGNIKKSKLTDQSISGEAMLKAEAGPKIKVKLEILKISIIDVSFNAGVNFSLGATEKISRVTNVVNSDGKQEKTTTWTCSIAFESHLRLPLITLKVGYDPGTLANKLNIKYSWDLVNKQNAALDWMPPHLNCETAIWTYTETEMLEGEDVEQESSRFDLKQYTLILTGEPQHLELELLEGKKAPKVVWTSDDPSIATVDDKGLVTPVSTGVTVVTVANKDNPNEAIKCTIIVQEMGESNWEFLPADMEISIA